MIPLRDIIAWQAQAPWPRQEQVEQDYLLTQAMGLIFSDRFLSAQVAMRGGTVLHKVHLAPAARYSEDIDLVQIGDRPPAHIARALIRVLSPLLGPPRQNAVEFVTLTIRNMVQKSKIIRQEYEFQPTSAPIRSPESRSRSTRMSASRFITSWSCPIRPREAACLQI